MLDHGSWSSTSPRRGAGRASASHRSTRRSSALNSLWWGGAGTRQRVSAIGLHQGHAAPAQ
eukprot:3518399-Rhodomonas_salina.2